MPTNVRATSQVVNPADLRPMPYGQASARSIRDAIFEPLWGGRRALVDLFGDELRIRDQDGEILDGYDLLREAVREAAQAMELVLDGYLLPAPLRDTTGAEALMGQGTVPTPAQMGRQLLIGGGLGSARRDQVEANQARQYPVASSSPTAFVAIDLLWLDGEPLVDVPLAERKRLLDGVIRDCELVRRTVAVRAPVEAWYAQWRALGFHEVAVKGANSRYTPGVPSRDWATALIPRR